MFKPTCKKCGTELSWPTYGNGRFCSGSCIVSAKQEWKQRVRAYWRSIGVENGFITPTYQKSQLTSVSYDQAKLRSKMTNNWKEIADATGFNYDGTPKT